MGDRTVTLDKPLAYDVPVDSTSDGSAKIDGKVYASKASPLVDPVLGVGLEGFHITQDVPDVPPSSTVHNYGNVCDLVERPRVARKEMRVWDQEQTQVFLAEAII